MTAEQPTAPSAEYWKKCNSCKKPIAYKAIYWVCNVSTCNRKRTGLSFCSVSCWDAHVPGMNHRESWAEERRAPTYEQACREHAESLEPVKRTRAPKPTATAPVAPSVSGAAQASKVILRRKSES
jgi:hypothetical protein